MNRWKFRRISGRSSGGTVDITAVAAKIAKTTDSKAALNHSTLNRSNTQQHSTAGEVQPDMNIATYIKKEFDKKFGPKWHCIPGRELGSYITRNREGKDRFQETAGIRYRPENGKPKTLRYPAVRKLAKQKI
ncbi:hypothetical protein QR680_000344 [Steinernema hermaphroditum]|uniref:Dynein light chain n=1 Tax=Steinernema hermaphroditum TaxID=289476 RepID=A0AA39GU95_9BILA|nr:hypothetical protein QR680_000344 [Steinernema hermaphroditum]